MTNNIINFVPKAELDFKKNLKDFLEFAESLLPLNNKLDYQSNYWAGAVNFTKLGRSSKDKSEEALLHKSILRFAKAYVTYSQTHNRAKTFNEMKAIRAIEHVMVEDYGVVDICKIDTHLLNKAASIISQNYSGFAGYHGGSHLEKLKDFLISKKIISPLTWFNPIPKPSNVIDRVGEEADALRYQKLPDEDAIMALAEIFSQGVESLSQRDIFITSSVAILLSAPARASELFYLKHDCLHEDRDKTGNMVLGLKWYSGKGYGFEVESVPSIMEGVVREAVRRLQGLSKAAREFALELEEGDSNLIEGSKMSSFPYVEFKTGNNDKVKWSEALYAMFKNQLHSLKSNSVSKLWMPTIGTLNEDLSKTKKKIRGKSTISNVKSIFERYGYYSYSLKSHQFRHLLTTIAKVNGMQDELLTKWSGRADSKHNRVYNHTTPEQYNNQLAIITGSRVNSNNVIPIPEVFKPSTIQEINANSSLTLHQTEFGVCIQSYISSPCTKFRNCITCSEQVCIKGDAVKLERLKKQLEIEESILESDKEAIGDGSLGADRHYKMRLDKINIIRELISKLTDINIPDGSLVKVKSELDMSYLDRTLEINNKKRLPIIEKQNIDGATVISRPSGSFRSLIMGRKS
jgi:hypothetical protein